MGVVISDSCREHVSNKRHALPVVRGVPPWPGNTSEPFEALAHRFRST